MKDHKLGKAVATLFCIGALVATLFGCQKQEGPAERAGKSIDKATEKVGEKIEKTGEKIQDAVKGNKK